MKVTRNISLLIIAVVHWVNSIAQVFYNDAGQREKHFIYEVKQIDEFLERFNNDKNSFIRKVYESYNKEFKIPRSALVTSLFNYETQQWDSLLIQNFTNAVVNEQSPSYLNFGSPLWYAEVQCNFRFRDSSIDIPIILRVDEDREQQARWLITAAQSNINYTSAKVAAVPKNYSKHFIHPASQGNNFINLPKILDDKTCLACYFDENFFRRPESLAFYNALLDGKLQLVNIRKIRYHFTQVNGWLFTVEQFRRKSLNSGWLISTLQPASEADKKLYIGKLINNKTF